MATPLEEAVQTGFAPAMQYLMEKGRYFPEVVSSFPTMSVNIESTLLTGVYADQHHLPALIWYHEDEQRIVNYGTGIKEVMKTGFTPFVNDMFYQLNNVHLSKDVKTIHEELAERGMTSASINNFVYRGYSERKIKLPKPLQMLTGDKSTWDMQTPSLWSLGAFSTFNPRKKTPQLFSDNYKESFRETKHLIKKRKLPYFTICTVQDLDLRVHLKGPMDIAGIHKIDRELQKLLGLYGRWDEALKACTWIILSDNGHASMGHKRKQYVIDLRKRLKGFRIMKDTRPTRNDEIALAVNQRTAFIYCIGTSVEKKQVIARLQQDRCIDIIAWGEAGQTHVVSGEKAGHFSFVAGGDYVDTYRQTWTIAGNEKLLDLTVKKNRVEYSNYPDALARLSSSLRSHKGDYVVATAKPGYEFQDKGSPIHVDGAAHGSLHKQESSVPMIVVGTDSEPEYERIVDLKPWLLRLLGGG
ncbi:hypothetical protein DT065_03795 [Salicibibacter kimchii]|uniref:Alkaline phosphatase family protein n=2 Tax=Salicibibacter kimchii TaxID=2099786 RepID=A0A345C3S0_9BACI|nr:hypothetical protein DT065_03795 [Salicibibacter kimchii]